MEELVRKASSHAIFRLPQVVGNTPNPNILVNFLFQKIMSNEHFKVWRHAYRNIIDIEDVRAIAKILIDDGSQARQTSNIACPISMSVIDLVEVFEKVLGRAAEYSLVEAGAFYEIDTTRAEQVAEKAGVRFDDDYVERVVRKYYAQ
jgi:hypothetical protein